MNTEPLGSRPKPLQPPELSTVPLAEVIPSQSQDPWTQAIADSYLAGNPSTPGDLDPVSRQAWQDLASLSADGLTRTHLHWVPPAALSPTLRARDWEQTADGLPVADVVVIGCGPAGLATSYHLAQGGARVVTLEASYAGQAFSDAGAASVHSMRTNRLASSLIRTGRALEDLATVMGLPANVALLVGHAARGRQLLESRTGVAIQGLAQGSDSDWNIPASRGELFAHLAQLSHYLAQGCENSLLLERSPVQKVSPREDGLLEIETSPGHRLACRQLVLATGLVQPEGGNARIPAPLKSWQQSHPQHYRLAVSPDQLDHALQAPSPIVSEQLLGRPQLQGHLRSLPEGSPVAIVGSGESAIKAALEVLAQSPKANVYLLCKGALEVAQVQIPGENMHPIVLEQAVRDPDYGQASLQRYRELFGTPITPRSFLELIQAQVEGRLHILELDRGFDLQQFNRQPDGSLRLRDNATREALRKQHQEYREHGLEIEVPENIPSPKLWISAAGFEREKAQWTPLVEQLIEGGLAGRQGDHLQPGPQLTVNSSSWLRTAADSAIPGMAVRGRQVAEELLERLPRRPLPAQAEPPENPGADWAHGYSREDFLGFVRHRGLAPNWVAELPQPPYDLRTQAQLDFPDPERFLRGLAERPPEQLTPAEKLTLSRAHQLLERLGTPSLGNEVHS